jgi:hypothetical protein
MPIERVVRIYKTRAEADRAISKAVSDGWVVDSFQVHDMRQGWACWKTCCLGLLFLPLALLGRKPDEYEYIVTFSRETAR